MNHEQTQIHKTHHNLDLKEATTFPLIVYFVPNHDTSTQMSFCSGTPTWEFSQLGLPRLWRPITLCENLQLRWGLKQNCNPCRELFNGIWHTTYTQGNWSESRLLVVRSQIDNLTSNPFFGHNLCFKCPNGSCKPILDIYVLRSFSNDIRNFSV